MNANRLRKTVIGIALGLGIVLVPVHVQAAEDTADPVLAQELEIRELLLEKGGKPAIAIQVTVDRGTAILTGEVPGRPMQELAEEVARSVAGIKKVDNRLRLSPAAAAALEGTQAEREFADAQLEIKVKRALNAEIGKHSKSIEVEVVDDVVSLRGTVPDESRKKIALETAGKVRGVTRVVDLIRIGN